jgi:molecular chaperone IbpA
VITGKNTNTPHEVTYLHKGIASRAFTRQFYLAEYMEVVSATIVNGILIINLEKIVPEDKKPKTIKIV